MIYPEFIKRILDILASIFLLVILSPLFFVVTLLCFFGFKGKPFFTQQRVGMHEKIIRIIKFKTMADQFDTNKNPLPDRERLTPLGRFIRKSSLDELPQLINVLKGDMSIVGPRPLLLKYLPWYTEKEKIRHTVRPGITGLAQIKGRNFLTWDQRLQYDVQYAEQISFTLDVSILLKTINRLLFSGGVATDPRSLMEDMDVERSRKQKQIVDDRIILRKPVEADAEQLLAIKNNREAALLLEDQNNGYTLPEIKNWINFHLTNTSNLMYVIENSTVPELIGHVALYDINHTNGTCEFGILIGLPVYWGQGIGQSVTDKMIAIAFDELHLEKIFLNVLAVNLRAVNLYRKTGFQIIEETDINILDKPEKIFRMVITKNDLQIH